MLFVVCTEIQRLEQLLLKLCCRAVDILIYFLRFAAIDLNREFPSAIAELCIEAYPDPLKCQGHCRADLRCFDVGAPIGTRLALHNEAVRHA